MQTTKAILCLLLVVPSCYSWHEIGHYTITYIAQKHLLETRPEVVDWVLKILEPLSEECGEKDYPFLESSSWADKARVGDWRLLMYHHFISISWFDEGSTPVNYFTEKSANVTFGIQQSIEFLKKGKDDPFAKSLAIFGQGISLRLLIHFVGDIHQPLHASDRITPSKPQGDFGGNLFKISHFGDKVQDNLHYLWDTMFEDPKLNIKGYITKQGYDLIRERAESIMAEYPYKKLESKMEKSATLMSWAYESHSIAKRRVYSKNIVEFGKIPEDYITIGRHICRTRAALAGYRLAKILEDIYLSLYPDETEVDL